MRTSIALLPIALVLIAPSALAGAPPRRVADASNVTPPPPKAGAKKARRPKKRADPPPPVKEEAEAPSESDPATAPARTPEAAPVAASPKARDRATDSEDGTARDAAPGPVSIAPLLGYASTHANLGVGIRGGYTLPMGLYLGGTVVYHFGTSVDVPSPTGGTFTSSVHLVYPGAEVGYELPVGPVVLRPYAGIGVLVAIATSSGEGSSSSDTTSSLAFWPGCTATYGIPSSKFFVGADTRLLIATSGGDPSFGVFATGGMRF